MSGMTILPPACLRIECLFTEEDAIKGVLISTVATSACPLCGVASGRVQSHYFRMVAELPWSGVAVQFTLWVRRFYCDNPGCARKIFTERLPEVVRPYGRKTVRLEQALAVIAFAEGGEGGARTARSLGMTVSPDTLLRLIRREKISAAPAPRALGVDDWSFRRGKSYGTILVDLERHAVIDLLADRESETLAMWLQERSGIEIITRDRSGAYAEGARIGAPTAVQVADRWHLLKNLGEAVERFLTNHNQYLREAAAVVISAQLNSSSAVINASPRAMLSSRNDQEIQKSREKRYARYCEVRELRRQGVSVLGIAKALGMSRMTVYKYIQADDFPERAPTRPRGSQLEGFIPYIHRRYAEGYDTAAQLWREIVAQGYSGGAKMVRRYVGRLRARLSRLSQEDRLKVLSMEANFKTPSSRRAMWWLVKGSEDLTADQKLFIAQLCRLYPVTVKVRELAHSFQDIVRQRASEKLDEWLAEADKSGIAEIKGFADGLRRDLAAVIAALKYEWSNGQTEGQVNRLKTLKRQMYGRAKLDLLEARILHPT